MDISSVAANSGVQYTSKAGDTVQEKAKAASESEVKKLGIGSAVSLDSLSQESQDKIKSQLRGNGNRPIANHWIISGNSVSADGTVSFYGASMTKEQSEKLQSVIKELEEQGHGNLGDSWNTAAYAQLGLKVSQLSYACKEIGLSDEAAEQVTKTYGQQAEDKISKVNDMITSMAKNIKEIQEQFYKEHGTPDYRKGAQEIKESLVQRSSTGKTSVELNIDANVDIYKMFSNLDVSGKDTFVSSFQKSLESFKNYLAGGEVPIFTGTDTQQAQIAELTKRFQSFLEA